MATAFGKNHRSGPNLISSAPQASQAQNAITAGLEHRPFSDDEIKQAFDTFDLDKNHFVGAAEISHILQVIGEDVTDEEIDEMIRMCDTDGDGQVTFDEFFKLMTNPPPALPPAARQTSKQKMRSKAASSEYARHVVGLADPRSTSTSHLRSEADASSNGSRRPTLKDQSKAQSFRVASVEALVRKLSGGFNKIKPSQIKKVYKRFQDIDIDKSGAIDYHEFIEALEMEDDLISRQMFRIFDMDGSGTIELKEFIVVLSRFTSAAQNEKLKFAFMMFDEDGSGCIERDELLDILNASFIIEGLSLEELEEKADAIFDFLELPRDGAITYEDFLKLSKAKGGMIYPVEASKLELGQDASFNQLYDEVR